MLEDDKAQGYLIGSITILIASVIVLSVLMPSVSTVMEASMGTVSSSSSMPVPVQSVATPVVTLTPVQNVGESVKTTNLNIHAEKTNVVVGEDILIKLSAVNLITKKTMHIQVILVPPSGMGVSTSTFVFSGAGQYTSDFRIEPGQGRDIEIALVPNQAGDFNIEGRAVYYFGDDIINSEDYRISVPVHVTSNDAVASAVVTEVQVNEQIDNQITPFDNYLSVFPLLMIVTFIGTILLLVRSIS